MGLMAPAMVWEPENTKWLVALLLGVFVFVPGVFIFVAKA